MKNLSLCITIVFLLFGCASIKVHHQGAVPENFSEVKATYGWLKNTQVSSDIRANNQTIELLIHQSVDRYLQSKGYKRIDADGADYLITWFGKIKEEVKEISVSQFYSSYGYGSLAGRLKQEATDGKVVKTFTRGTLILDVLDPESKTVLWRGNATNTIQENMSEEDVEKYIDLSVKKILKTIPKR